MTITINGTTGIAGVDGSASVPAFQGNDTDTGIFYPAANEVAAAAGGSAVWNASSTFGFKNRIINGGMVIDQRNAGASVTPANGDFIVDRFQYIASQASKVTAQQNAGSVTPPAGFTKYLGITSSSAYSIGATDFFNVSHKIEGFNTADLAWGTANAATVTLSFWVRSSLTGTFGGTIFNNAQNRYYPFSYTISAANTWEKKTITIAGDTSGTWATDNSVGMRIMFGLGVGSTYSGTAGSWGGTLYYSVTGATSVVGTNGATFYITGVQLERGSTATSFDFRSISTELPMCQRYYWKSTYGGATTASWGTGVVYSSTTNLRVHVPLPTPMRTGPTMSMTGTLYVGTGPGAYAISSFTSQWASNTACMIDIALVAAQTLGQGCVVYHNGTTTDFIQANSEL